MKMRGGTEPREWALHLEEAADVASGGATWAPPHMPHSVVPSSQLSNSQETIVLHACAWHQTMGRVLTPREGDSRLRSAAYVASLCASVTTSPAVLYCPCKTKAKSMCGVDGSAAGARLPRPEAKAKAAAPWWRCRPSQIQWPAQRGHQTGSAACRPAGCVRGVGK